MVKLAKKGRMAKGTNSYFLCLFVAISFLLGNDAFADGIQNQFRVAVEIQFALKVPAMGLDCMCDLGVKNWAASCWLFHLV